MPIQLQDTIYKDLKQKGLELTCPCSTTVPEPQPIKTGIIRKLSSLVSPRKQPEAEGPMLVAQIMNNSFIAIRKHTVYVYKYIFDENQKQVRVQQIQFVNLQQQAKCINTCGIQSVQDKDFPILFQTSQGLHYFNYDLKEQKLQERNFVKLANILGVGWISDKQCIIVNDVNVYHFTISQQLLKQKSVRVANLACSPQEKVKKIWVVGVIDEHQDTRIPIFYATVNKVEDPDVKYPSMKLKIKQYNRTLEGELTEQENSNYFVQTQSLEYRDKFTIYAVGDYYCLGLNSEILILRKKFNKYMLLDNLVQVMSGFEIKLCKKGFIVSIGQKILQLNCIHFSDPKCTSRILDVIEFPQEMLGFHKSFKQIWPILNGKEYTLMFLFVDGFQITLSGLTKLEPMTKMLDLVKSKPNQNLQIIQDMANNLGIPRKDFYLKLWSTSKKMNIHIYQFLIPCKDVLSIQKQMKSVLRTRTIQVSQILKILQKITEINLQNLRQDLNQKNLRQFLKNDFLKRKIKLNEMDKMLDHRIFDSIYNSSILSVFHDIVSFELDPVPIKIDPLHSNSDYQVCKQLKSLQNVFQEFKVVILQDYKTFLRSFLSRFPHKILQAISRFFFLLPNYPFEIQVQKPSKTNQPILLDPKTNDTVQPLWFQTVTVRQWKAELTKQRILQQLFNDYPTSKIIQTIDEFNNSVYGRENKRWKHGLIVASLQQYTKKIKQLNGTQLYLNICQFVNQLSVENDGDPKISEKLLQILRQKNNLSEPDMHYCKLYSSMHYFMLKNKIISKNKLDIQTLANLKPENLVAIFFLENKQRKQHIFSSFKDLYSDKNEFKQVLTKFVASQNCSRIQLQILMDEMMIKGHEFQQQNQDLIQILISGICMKVEIRQNLLILDADEQDSQNSLVDDILLSKQLALKVNRIKQLKRAKDIFKVFNMDKNTYKQLIDLQQDNKIFVTILQKYFEIVQSEDYEGNFEIVIQDVVVNLDYYNQLLKLLIYLQEAVYYSAEMQDIFLIFGQKLILQKQFQEIRNLINDDNTLQTLKLNKQDIIISLTVRALQYIYLDPQIVYKQQTKQQILQILSIDDQYLSRLRTRQLAKLDLADIFSEWVGVIHPSQIHIICSQWKKQNRAQIMIDLIQCYIDNLDFTLLKRMYQLLEITDKETSEVSYKNKQFVGFCDLYAKKLLEKKRYQQVIDVIVFLMSISGESINYAMLVESYIQNVILLTQQNKNLGRRYLQFFVQKYDVSELYNIKHLLEQYFDESAFGLWDRAPTIIINNHYYFDQTRKVQCEINLDQLWEMAQKQSQSVSQLYYTYFFLAMGLSNPNKGFAETVGISYNLEKLTNLLLTDLDELFENNQQLWYVDYGILQAQFLFQGMLGEAAHVLEISTDKFDKQKKSKFEMILKELRVRKGENDKNQKILNILNKLKGQVLNKGKRATKKDRFKLKMKQLMDKQNQKKTQEIIVEETPVETSKPEVYLNWKAVMEYKREISNASEIPMSEKQLIDSVYRADLEKSQVTIVSKKAPKKTNFFQQFLMPYKGAQKAQKVTQLLKKQKYSEIGTYPANVVSEGITKLFAEDPTRDYNEVLTILQACNIGDTEKKQIFLLAKFFPCPNQTRRQLFSVPFLMNPITYTDQQQKYELIYKELEPKIKQLSKKLKVPELKQLSNLIETILQSPKYSAKVYYEALLHTGQNLPFDSNSALMARQFIDHLGDYPQIVEQNYQQIIDKMTIDQEMKHYVTQNLIKLMHQKKYEDVVVKIKEYVSNV